MPFFERYLSVWVGLAIVAGVALGLAVPGLFIYMIGDCVKRRANQSATGILYVTLVLVILGEGTALTLLELGASASSSTRSMARENGLTRVLEKLGEAE